MQAPSREAPGLLNTEGFLHRDQEEIWLEDE